MSDGAASCLLVSEKGLEKLIKAGANVKVFAKVTGIGSGIDAMRMADRPHLDFNEFLEKYALLHEKESKKACGDAGNECLNRRDEKKNYYRDKSCDNAPKRGAWRSMSSIETKNNRRDERD
mgnify:CR=1 FL=1